MMDVLEGGGPGSNPSPPDPQGQSMAMGAMSPDEGPPPPSGPLSTVAVPVAHNHHPSPQDTYWNLHLDALSKLKNEGKDWYEDSRNQEDMLGPVDVKQEVEHYYGMPMAHMPPEGVPTMPPHHLHHQAYQHEQHHHLSAHFQHFPGYQSQHSVMSDMSPLSPSYPRAQQHHGSPHLAQPYGAQQYPGPHMGVQHHPGQHMPSPYSSQPLPHMGQAMGGAGHHLHEGGREGDPYSFVDECTGPPPRPVEEVLGQSQPKRRGRKPKHIKLMENGGDPVAIAAAQAAHEAKKRKWRQIGPDGKVMTPISTVVKPRKKVDRFDGLPEEEIAKKTLPDHLGPNLDIVIISKFPFQVGINPGLFAAYKGHHYAGPGNHFWKCLYLSGLIPEPLSSEDDQHLLQHGVGFTNIVARTTRGSTELTRKEIKEGGQILLSKLQQFQPRIAVFNGKGIYEIFSGKKEFTFGRQPEKIEGTHTHVWVMPSSSARCAQLPRALDKVPFYTALRKFRDFLKGTLNELDEEEMTFTSVKVKNYKSECDNSETLRDTQSMVDSSSIEEHPLNPDVDCPLGLGNGPLNVNGPLSLVDSCGQQGEGQRDYNKEVKEELDGLKLEIDYEEEDVLKNMPRSLYNLGGMNREQLEMMEFPTIPIRKKRGRPKKTPDDPNAPPKPRPRPCMDPLLCNGDEIPKKKRGRPKKIQEDGTIAPPKKPGRKPKALKEMLQQQLQQQQHMQMQHGGHPSAMPQNLSTRPPPHQQSMSIGPMNGLISPQGYSPSPNPGGAAFSSNYANQTSVHPGAGGHTPNHSLNGHTSSVANRGPTPQQFGQSPGYSPGSINGLQQTATPYSLPSESTSDIHTDEDHLCVSPSPVSPVMAQPDFEPPTSMLEDEPRSAPEPTVQPNLTPSHPDDHPQSLAALDQPQSNPVVSGQFSNPSTPVDGSSTPYHSYPSYPTHSPPVVKSVFQAGQSPKLSTKSDVSSKSLSGLESLVDQIPNLSEHESNSQHSTHSNSCSNPTTPGPPSGHAPFSPGHVPPTTTYNYPNGSYPPATHYNSPQSSHPYSPHYSSNSTNHPTDFSVSSLANSSITTSLSYTSSGYEMGSQAGSNSNSSSSSFSVSSLTGGSPTPAPSMYSNSSYSPAPLGPPSGPPSSYPDITSPPILAPTPPMGASFMGSPGLMNSPSPMSSSMGSSSMGTMSGPMGMGYPYSQYGDSSPGYPSPGHSSFPSYPTSAPSFHMPSPRFPYHPPYANSPYSQGYSQNSMLERIKQTGMGYGGY